MGLFSSKKKRIYSTGVQRVIEDADIRTAKQGAQIAYAYRNIGRDLSNLSPHSMADFLKVSNASSILAKSQRAFRYAESGRYFYGDVNCEQSIESEVSPATELKGILEDRLGTEVTVLYAKIGDRFYSHQVWQILLQEYAYSFETNTLVIPGMGSIECFLKTATIQYTQETQDLVYDPTYYNQPGLSFEFGQTPARTRDTSRPPTAADKTTLPDKDKALVQYVYREYVESSEPPPVPVISSYQSGVLTGSMQQGATLAVLVGSTQVTTASGDAQGHFSIAVPGDPTPINVRALNSEGIASAAVVVNSGYSGPAAPDGPAPQLTEEIREGVIEILLDPEADAIHDMDYLCAMYQEASGQYGLLTYLQGTGDSDLDMNLNYEPGYGQFMPRLYAKLNGVQLNQQSKTSPAYISSRRMARLMGIDWSPWVTKLCEGLTNPDMVKTLLVTQAVPATTTDPHFIKYLFEFFQSTYDHLTEPATTDTFGETKPGKLLKIEDDALRHDVAFSKISIGTVSGVLGSDYESGYCPTVYAEHPQLLTTYVLEEGYHYYRKQVTQNTYLEIRVFGLYCRYLFAGGSISYGQTTPELTIPMDHTLLNKFSRTDQEILLSKGLHMFLHSYQEIKIKWYQRLLKVVGALVSIALSVMTFGAGGSIAALVMAGIVSVGVGMLVSAGIKLAAKLLIKLGVSSDILIAITAIAVILLVRNPETFSGGFFKTPAEALGQIVNVGAGTYSEMNVYETKKYLEELALFQKESAEKMQELLDQRKELGLDREQSALEIALSNPLRKQSGRILPSVESFLQLHLYSQDMPGTVYAMFGSYLDVSTRLRLVI